MSEVLRVVVRAIGVVLPGAGFWGIVELRGGAPAGDFAAFLTAAGLSLLTAGAWSAVDAWRDPVPRVLIRWVVTGLVFGVGWALYDTWTTSGGPPGADDLVGALPEALLFIVPLLAAAVVGVAIGADESRRRRRPLNNDTHAQGQGR